MDKQEKYQLLFTHLVLSLHTATIQQLGKLKHPITGKIEQDLPGAQGSIEMLEMIKEKTKGNLSADEDRFITQALHELRLNYVEEVTKQQNKPSAEQSKPEETPNNQAPS